MLKIRVIIIRIKEPINLKKIIILASIFTLSACATPEKWQALTLNPSPLEPAKNMCFQQAKERYPVIFGMSTGTTFPSMTVDGKTIPGTSTRDFPSDRNEWDRKEYFNNCMKAEGWENKNKVTGLLAFLFND